MLRRRKATVLGFQALVAQYRLAEMHRVHLAAAGVDRAELFESSSSRRPIRFHDTRATFVTVALAVGRTEAWVSARTRVIARA